MDNNEVFGIDLGTTNSCISHFKDGKPQIISLDGRTTVPSVVAFHDGNILVGMAAKNRSFIDPLNSVQSIKRRMGERDYSLTFGEETYTPESLSTIILKYLKAGAEKETGLDVSKVVITVPAWFRDNQRQATLRAAEGAGLEVLRIINEPTAAALCYSSSDFTSEKKEQTWLVYDLGGGTFDVSILRVTPDMKEVLASSGNTLLGGDDFDKELANLLLRKLKTHHDLGPFDEKMLIAKLVHRAEALKCELSEKSSVTVKELLNIKDLSLLLNLTVSRSEFVELIESYIESTVDKVNEAISEARIEIGDIDRLLLVGGSTRIPLIAERLGNLLNLTPESYVDPDLSVAYGAAIQAGLVSGKTYDQLVVDVCPHSLGIAVADSSDIIECLKGEGDMEEMLSLLEGGAEPDLIFRPLIRKNSKLPARFEEVFYKGSRMQEMALIEVYQGESESLVNNHAVGSFQIPFSNDETPELAVGFHYDLNGVITIEVNEKNGNSKSFTMDLSRSVDLNSEIRDEEDYSASEADKRVSNFLVNKVEQLIAKNSTTEPEILSLLEQYRELLRQENDDSLDEIEDQLFAWVEEQEENSETALSDVSGQ